MTTSASHRICPDDCLECWLVSQLDRHSCDGSSELVDDWLDGRDVDQGPILDYLQSLGGFCSCEVLTMALDRRRSVVNGVVLACGR